MSIATKENEILYITVTCINMNSDRKFSAEWSCGKELYEVQSIKEKNAGCHVHMYIESYLSCW